MGTVIAERGNLKLLVVDSPSAGPVYRPVRDEEVLEWIGVAAITTWLEEQGIETVRKEKKNDC